jgi:hypothetical protein
VTYLNYDLRVIISLLTEYVFKTNVFIIKGVKSGKEYKFGIFEKTDYLLFYSLKG